MGFPGPIRTLPPETARFAGSAGIRAGVFQPLPTSRQGCRRSQGQCAAPHRKASRSGARAPERTPDVVPYRRSGFRAAHEMSGLEPSAQA